MYDQFITQNFSLEVFFSANVYLSRCLQQADAHKLTVMSGWFSARGQLNLSREQAASALSHVLMRCDHELFRASYPAQLILPALITSYSFCIKKPRVRLIFF